MILVNNILLGAVVAWVSAQMIKSAAFLIRNKKLSVERLFGAGGMPSSHSAMVCSAMIAVLRKEGFASTYFAIMSLFAFIVMYDAMGVRRAAGLHAHEINKISKIVEETTDALDIEIPQEPLPSRLRGGLKSGKLQEFLGHTPLEVLGGAALGLVIGIILPIK